MRWRSATALLPNMMTGRARIVKSRQAPKRSPRYITVTGTSVKGKLGSSPPCSRKSRMGKRKGLLPFEAHPWERTTSIRRTERALGVSATTGAVRPSNAILTSLLQVLRIAFRYVSVRRRWAAHAGAVRPSNAILTSLAQIIRIAAGYIGAKNESVRRHRDTRGRSYLIG